MIVTPAAAASVATADVAPYMAGVAAPLQYYNGPNAQYPFDWYLQRHLGNPNQFTMYRNEPRGICNTYYYQYQGVYYCFTGGAAAAMPDVLVPGMGIVPPSVLMPGTSPSGMAAGVVPGMMAAWCRPRPATRCSRPGPTWDRSSSTITARTTTTSRTGTSSAT